MALPATEAFTGTDGTSPPNANWTNHDLGVQIKSNAVAATGTDGFAYWNADVFADDQYAQVTLVGGAFTAAGPGVRMSGDATAANDYAYFLSCIVSFSTKLHKRLAGVLTEIADLGPVPATSDVMKLTVAGTTLTAYKNGVAGGSPQTDSAIASGSAGVYVNGTAAVADTWEGGNLEVARRFLLVRN